MRTWIRSPLAILSSKPADNGIVIEDDQIVELLSTGNKPQSPVDQVVDASESVLLPGLINTHHHYYQTLTRALPVALDKELFAWLKSLYPVWANLDEEMIQVATEMATAELLLSGCTTSADHHYLFPEASQNAIDAQIDGINKIGIRSVLTRGSMSVGADQGGLPPQSTVQDEDEILSDCERVIHRYHDATEGAMIQIALAPCSPFSVSTALMSETANLARRHDVRLHTHLAETQDETSYCEKMFGLRPLNYLEKVGWLSSDVWLAHGIFFNADEITRLGKAKTAITHCPSSNMVLGSGQCKTLDLESAGSPVGLGVDGSASNDGSNMIQEVRQALLLQRLRYGSARISHLDALRFATTGSAECLGRNDIGEIQVGKQADIALFKLDQPRFSGAADALAALVLCGADRADAVMVGGTWKVKDGELVHVDLPELQRRHTLSASKLQSL
ncbi:MAG: 8-oxoguanine deaminase [Acidiferrobacterales bacterium]|nr:8-oxoguanine deaminase [Acidiferrobacterales bacterium]